MLPIVMGCILRLKIFSNMIDIHTLTIPQAREALSKKEMSVVDLARLYIDTITAKNPEINAYLEVFPDWQEQAEEAQKRIDAGDTAPLLGVPLAIKDNILIHGKKASASSKMLENYVATYDATIITKLKQAGAIFLGRTNMDEFAMGGSTETSAYGVTKNPHDTSRVPGGSSGGSAAAVAMDGALAAIGTDTGGSIRQPASFCGLVGFKPTYGAVSRNGLIAMGSSLDQAGPLARTVTDAQILADIMKGVDPLDSTTIEIPAVATDKKPVIGVPRAFISGDGIDTAVKEHIDATIKLLKTKGYEVRDIELPSAQYALSIYYILMPAEVSSNLARYDGVRYGLHVDGDTLIEDYFKTRKAGFGREVRRRIMLGTYVLSAGYADEYYYKAEALRASLKVDFNEVFKTVDVILTPTAPTPAFKIGEKISDPVSMYLSDIFTVTANIVGIPAISLPTGQVEIDSHMIPIGTQYMAAAGQDDILFALGKDILGE